MAGKDRTREELLEENEELKMRLLECEETLGAIQNGEVDALILNTPEGAQTFTLESADYIYRVLIEEMNQGVAILTPDLYISYCNSQLASMAKVPLEMMIGKKITEFITKDELSRYDLLFEKPENQYKNETTFNVADGTILPIELFTQFLEDINTIYVIVTDLSYYKHTEEEIRAQANMLAQVNDAVIAFDNNYKVTYWNKGAERLYEIESSKMVGNKLSKSYICEWLEPEGGKDAYHSLKTKGYWHHENIHIKKNGEMVYVDALTTVLKDSHGNSKGMLAIIRDITKKRQVQMKLKDTITELERSNEELQSFAYITSHDLQEPLRTMASYAQLLKRRYEGQLDKDADDFIEFMVDGSKRMKSMIQGLLEYSRVGTKGGEFTNFNAEDALKHALSNLESAIKEVNTEVIFNELPVVYADKDQITRVFQNLIGNAIKFRKEGLPPKIHISAKKGDNEYVFSVSDNGIGLEEQYSDQIFEVFKKLHAIDEYQGAGIGLAIVKRIIDRHGGRVWVESELGKGSTFYFTIHINLAKT
jgi:PAS domain S-box-containing protein